MPAPIAAWPGMSLATTGGAARERLHDRVGGALGAAGRHEHVGGGVQRAGRRRSARARASHGPGRAASRSGARRVTASDRHADGLDAALAQRPHGLHEEVSALALPVPAEVHQQRLVGRQPEAQPRDLALLAARAAGSGRRRRRCAGTRRASRGAPRFATTSASSELTHRMRSTRRPSTVYFRRLRARIGRLPWWGVWTCQKTLAAPCRSAAIAAGMSKLVKCVCRIVGSSLSLSSERTRREMSPREFDGAMRNGIPSSRSSSSQTRSFATEPNTASHVQPRSRAARITPRSIGTNEPAYGPP